MYFQIPLYAHFFKMKNKGKIAPRLTFLKDLKSSDQAKVYLPSKNIYQLTSVAGSRDMALLILSDTFLSRSLILSRAD
jgi:hypothetical protein